MHRDYLIEVVSFKQMDHSAVMSDILYLNKSTEFVKRINIWVRDFKRGYKFHYQMHLKQAYKNWFKEWRINGETYKSHKYLLDLTTKMNLVDPFCSFQWVLADLVFNLALKTGSRDCDKLESQGKRIMKGIKLPFRCWMF